MSKYLGPKCKLCRRAGEKLMLKGERCGSPKCAMVKRNYPPGFHGPKGRGKISDYGQQLLEKQKAKRIYNLLEKQFKLTFLEAQKMKGNTGDNLLQLLEMRLDNVIYRLGLAASRAQARQLVNHGLFAVNGRGVNIPSYTVKEGDIVEVKKNKKNAKIFKNIENKIKPENIPGWLNFDVKKLSAKVLHKPNIEDIRANINTQMIVEFYSR